MLETETQREPLPSGYSELRWTSKLLSDLSKHSGSQVRSQDEAPSGGDTSWMSWRRACANTLRLQPCSVSRVHKDGDMTWDEKSDTIKGLTCTTGEFKLYPGSH